MGNRRLGAEVCAYSDISAGCSKDFIREHYLPRGLGNFRNLGPLCRSICENCHSELKPLDDVFLHNSPEAIFRQFVGVFGRKSHSQKPVFYETTHGTPPVSVFWKPSGFAHEILMELRDGEMIPLRQVILRGRGRQEFYHVYIHDKIKRADDFEAVLADKGLLTAKFVMAFSGREQDKDWIDRLVRRYRRRGQSSWARKFDPPMDRRVFVRWEVYINPLYYRAIAKIAFHSLLVMFDQFTGLEREFAELKQFIARGGNHSEFVATTKDKILPELRQGKCRTAGVISLRIRSNRPM